MGDDRDYEAVCLEKLTDILTQPPPSGRRCNDGPAQIVDHLYLGSMLDALDLRLLRRLHITHVLNCAPSAVRHYAESLPSHLSFEVVRGGHYKHRSNASDKSFVGPTGTVSPQQRQEVPRWPSESNAASCSLPANGLENGHLIPNGDSLPERGRTSFSVDSFDDNPYDPTQSTVRYYMEIDAADTYYYPILKKHYSSARKFFEGARDVGGRALVHCELGMNRSAALAVAYLVDSEQVTLTQAVRRLRIQRPNVLRNEGFRRQLVRFAADRQLLDRHLGNS